MPNASRNIFTSDGWTLTKLEDSSICESFDCADSDLNDYFHSDAALYRNELLTQTYCLHLSDLPSLVLALLDFCNDAVHIEQYRKVVEIDSRKQHRHLPAVKLTRFGVHRKFQSKNIGTHALNMAKRFFITDNRTGCRLLIVDAYNNPRVLNFYEKNGFKALIDTDKDKAKPTRALYFDLKRLVIC